MLVRATLILIALFVGGWMVFDGIHVLIYGRFFGPEKPGPWSAVVSSIGLNPLRFGVPFLLLGILWLLFVVAMQYQLSWAWYGALFVAIATLWFLPIGTLFSAVYIVLLLVFRSKLPSAIRIFGVEMKDRQRTRIVKQNLPFQMYDAQ